MKKFIISLYIWSFSILSYAQQRYITSEVKENIRARVDAGDNVSIVVGYFDRD